jgi:hypothetical protein
VGERGLVCVACSCERDREEKTRVLMSFGHFFNSVCVA